MGDMLKRGRGHIVTVASVAGLMGTYLCTDYSATKFAAVGFHESLFTELRVRSNRLLSQKPILTSNFYFFRLIDTTRSKPLWSALTLSTPECSQGANQDFSLCWNPPLLLNVSSALLKQMKCLLSCLHP